MSSSKPTAFKCPSCHAKVGEPCKLPARLAGYSHVSRHHLASSEDWRRLASELDIETGWTIGGAR